MSEPTIKVQSGGDGGILAQILVTTTQTQTDVAVMKEQMKAVPDHEKRIRDLEKWRYGLPLAGVLSAGSAGLAIYSALHH